MQTSHIRESERFPALVINMMGGVIPVNSAEGK
jgi:hypothetical protein